MIRLHDVSMHFGGPVLLDGVSLEVVPGRKVGVVGANGAGKSTLLHLLAGHVEPTEGRVARARGVRVGHQAQETPSTQVSVFDELRRVFEAEHARARRLEAIGERLADPTTDAAERGRLLAEYEEVQRAQEVSGGFDVDRRIETVLSSLGLPASAWHQPIASFSGGERNVIGLARVLLAEPDVLLLDEPSNHLDMDGVEWFVEFVRRSRAAVVVVSHDRHLLDAVAEEIWEVRGGKVTSWAGSYGDYQRQKAEALALQERQYRVQQRWIRRVEFQARRLLDMARAYDDPGQARRAKSMLARIERTEKIAAPDAGPRTFRTAMSSGERHGRLAFAVKDLDFAYGDRPIFEHASLEVERGERVALVGPNGSGKTTLLRLLVDRGTPTDATVRLGASVRVGEYRQLHDVLDASATLLDWAIDDTGLERTPAAALLHRFLFTYDDLSRPIGTLSGGEKSRLQLARLVHREVNLLLLDEPTNHLDVPGCEALEEALEEYDGTLLVVSHDRWFLDRLVTRVVEVRERKLVSFPVSFARWWEERRAAQGEGPRSVLGLHSRRSAQDARPDDDAATEREQRRARDRETRKARRDLAALETKIHRLEGEQVERTTRLEAAWAPEGDRSVALLLSAESEAARAEIAGLYAQWTALAASLPEGDATESA